MKKFISLSKIERKNLIQKVAFDLAMRFDVVFAFGELQIVKIFVNSLRSLTKH